jgi:hypothetical protein
LRLQCGGKRATIFDIQAQIAARAGRHHRRDADVHEAARDHAAEEAGSDDDDASHLSFTAR